MIRQLATRIPVLIKTALQTKLDGLELLQQDHMRVDSLFLRLRMSRDSKRRAEIFEEVRRELELHAQMEEEIFYPLCEKHEELSSRVAEARIEHQQIKALLKEMGSGRLSTEKMQARLKVLIEDVEHHVAEEENQFFAEVRRVLTRAQLERLGGQFRTFKQKHERATSKKRRSAKAA